jgi:hypothetical protein
MKNKKLIIIVVLFWTLAMIGCASNKQEPEMYDLLYRDTSNLAYKSITIEDYIAEDVCSS